MILLELYRLCGFWGIGSLFTLNITEIAKFEIGRLRPHFIAACNITGGLTEALCFEPNPLFNLTDSLLTNNAESGSGNDSGDQATFVQQPGNQQPYTQIYKVAKSFSNRDLSHYGSEL